MSCEVMYTCDHCNTHCSGEQYASIGRWDESGIIALGKTVHGCSKEHLGIALAKMFGIGINGETDELLNRKRRELTKLADANNFLIIERDNMRARVAELEKRIAELTAPVTVDGKTPGQLAHVSAECNSKYTAYYVWLDLGGEEDARKVATGMPRDHADKLANKINARAFGQPSQTTRDAVEALRRVRVEFVRFAADARMPGPLGTQYTINEILAITLNIIDAQLAKIEPELEERRSDHVHEPQKRFKYERAWLSEQTDDALFDLYMEHVKFFDMSGTMTERNNMIETLAVIECDEPLPDTSTESGLPDAVLAAITLPTKPTKPLRERLEELAAYWYRGDKDDKELNGAYRLARRECAKELREVINDPR